MDTICDVVLRHWTWCEGSVRLSFTVVTLSILTVVTQITQITHTHTTLTADDTTKKRLFFCRPSEWSGAGGGGLLDRKYVLDLRQGRSRGGGQVYDFPVLGHPRLTEKNVFSGGRSVHNPPNICAFPALNQALRSYDCTWPF